MLHAQSSGTIKEQGLCPSNILGKSVNFTIYLPPGYEENDRAYPIVYLLHGYTDDHTGWVQFGEIGRIADNGIKSGDFPPMVIVMPDAGVTWYVNDAASKARYEDFFIQEFIPYIEEQFAIRKQKEFRALAGLSMGGYGSLLYAMKHPDLFAAATPLSAAIYTEEEVIGYDQERWDHVEGPMYGKGLEGKERITDHWKANNPFYLAEQLGAVSLKKVRYYFDCGDEDFLYKGNASFHITLRNMEVPHEFRIRDGAHTWSYWRTGIVGALRFIGESFHR